MDARERYARENQLTNEGIAKDEMEARSNGVLALGFVRVKRVIGTVFWFAKPLGMLVPRWRTGEEGRGEVEEEGEEAVSVLESRGGAGQGWDGELTKVALAYGAYVMVIVSLSSCFLRFDRVEFVALILSRH